LTLLAQGEYGPPVPTQDELVAVLQAYQDKLTEALQQGGFSRYEQVFANPPAGVAVHEMDTTATIKRVNHEELRILGYTTEQMVGRPIWEFVVMSDLSRQSVLKKLAGQKDIKPFVRTFRRADGTGVAMVIVDRRLSDHKGQPVGIRTAMMVVGEG